VIVELDTTTGVPPYEQVRDAIERAVADGTLAPGTRLPPVRTLASDLGLAANTVARAYRELEGVGTLVGRGRHGTFVVDRTAAAAGAAESARLAAEAYVDVDRVRALGIDPDAALRLVRIALGR
jgi:DNA-binding transcriptional regulator YhcF (GntR family)